MKLFKKIYIEITNVCNLSCSFCQKSNQKPARLTTDSFQYILNQIKPFTGYIYLHVKGEPLLHPEIPEFLDISYTGNFHVNITTNGVLIDKLGDKLLDKPAIRQINFSLHSFTENKKPGYLSDILDFTEKAIEKTQMYISLRLWNFDKSRPEVNDLNRNVIKTITERFPVDFDIMKEITPGKGLKLRERLYLNTDFEFEWPDLKNKHLNENGFCYALRDQVGILADGTVVPCCLDGEGIINLGNIFKSDFAEIIENERAKSIYNGFTNRKAVENLCKHCRYKERFE
ncbi:MAG: radical SAM/SPASM domain-containing protein [Bacteroidales bacterium]